MRLDKFLSEMEIGTRSQVKEYIKKGLVEVNNIIIKKSDYKIDENNDSIIFNGKSISYQKYKYYMLNKPAGVVSATKDNFDKTVLPFASFSKYLENSLMFLSASVCSLCEYNKEQLFVCQ